MLPVGLGLLWRARENVRPQTVWGTTGPKHAAELILSVPCRTTRESPQTDGNVQEGFQNIPGHCIPMLRNAHSQKEKSQTLRVSNIEPEQA